uniref:4-coumarate:CoA ligase n=1 Tax=Inonotus obliquus TaxID=167356 RepID=A0A097JTN6_9AGAM|nr:4-coumarate:CoA ligase [Inonotus obliquus]
MAVGLVQHLPSRPSSYLNWDLVKSGHVLHFTSLSTKHSEKRYPLIYIWFVLLLQFLGSVRKGTDLGSDDWKYGWNKPIFIDAEEPSRVITAEQLLSLTKRIGRGLRDAVGVRTGDIVLLSATNSILVPALMLGILCAGATITGANPRFTVSELSYQVRDSGAKAIFTVQDSLDTVLQCVKALGLSDSIVYLATLDRGPIHGLRTLGDLLVFGEMGWERMTTEAVMKRRSVFTMACKNSEYNKPTAFLRIAALNYSSGTTGLPKGCMITVYNIVAHCEQQRIVHDLGRQELRTRGSSIPETDVVIAFLPFYHACTFPFLFVFAVMADSWCLVGQQQYIFNAVRNGDSIYVMTVFSFPALLHYIPKYRITTFAAVPPVVVLLAKHPDVLKTDFSSLHSITCGAAPLGSETQLQAETAMNTFKKGQVKIIQGWGMSEGVCGSCIFALHERDASGVGYLLSGMSARLVPADGSDYSRSLGLNQEGEVLLKGPNIFPGYWQKEKETSDAFTEDGWYKTGDIGVMERDGKMRIVDRRKELIKVQGFQVAPAELEDLLLKSPEGTEFPRAYVVPSPSRRLSQANELEVLADEIRRFVSDRVVRHKHLTGGIVFVESIPKNPSGKILRRELRDRSRSNDGSERVWISETSGKIQAKL